MSIAIILLHDIAWLDMQYNVKYPLTIGAVHRFGLCQYTIPYHYITVCIVAPLNLHVIIQ